MLSYKNTREEMWKFRENFTTAIAYLYVLSMKWIYKQKVSLDVLSISLEFLTFCLEMNFGKTLELVS